MESASELQTPLTHPPLTESETELLQHAQHIADTVLEPNAQAVDQSGEPPEKNLRVLAEVGLVGITTPRDWGGAGASGAFQREYTRF